jgi:glutaredoxin
MDKLVVLFTMKGCPYCEQMKEQLKESNLEFVERDINEHEEEYDLFVEVTENDYVPAFMIIESPEHEPKTHLFAPDRDFESIEDGVGIIREHLEK